MYWAEYCDAEAPNDEYKRLDKISIIQQQVILRLHQTCSIVSQMT